jgi:RHS repeat-associated protein
VGDFNGDGKTDIFMQSNGPGDSYLLLMDASGSVSAISQTVPASAMGLGWTGDQHHLVAGDFTGSGRAGLYLQPIEPTGVSAIVTTDQNGQFTASAPLQTWQEGYLGLKWSVSDANVYAGDFNGDGQADLLVQAVPISLSTNGSAFVSYPPNMNGVALAQPGAQPFGGAGIQVWSRNAFGVDWSPLSNQLLVADFSGDGRADVLFQPLDAKGAPSLLLGNTPGPIFTTSTGPLPSDIPISSNAAVLVAGAFSGGNAAQLLMQSTSRNGTNSIAKNIASGIHPRAVVFPTLSATSVAMAGIGYPGGGAPARLRTGVTSPLAATVAPTAAGRTAAQFSVSPTGAATYNIPLWTPPGARGIEPHLALHYTGGGPDGPMGPGWSLTGLSAIVRCGKTWASSSGAPAGVRLATTDDICLDGNRLRLTSGTQGAAGSTYQTEIADFSLVTAYASQGNGPQYFIVQGKDGRYYEYGNTTDSRIFSSGTTTPYAWALSKVRDRQGNNMVLTYSTGASALTLTKILYTATPGTGNAAPYEVDFNYVPRTGGSIISSYIGGGQVKRTAQLDNVTVLSLQPSPTVNVRTYQLGYAASTSTNRPLLQTVQECGSTSGTTTCIRPTTITYQPGIPGWNATASSLGVTIPANAQVFPMDLNGDGIADMVYPQSGGSGYQWYVKYGSATGTFGSAVYTGVTTLTSDPLFPADLAARGHPDLVYPSGGYYWRLYWNGTALATVSTGVPLVATSTPVGAADVNGDGLPDLIFADDNGDRSAIKVALNTTPPGGAASFQAVTNWYSFPNNVSCVDHNPCSEYHVHVAPNSDISVIQVADFDGDGRADLLVKALHKTKNPNTYYWAQLVSTGNNFTLTGSADSSVLADQRLTDWNGDGCTDILDPGLVVGSTWTIKISSCANAPSVGITTTIPSSQPIVLVDYDGDGRVDLLTTNGTANWQVARSVGDNIGPLTDSGLAVTTGFFTGDFNGDGLTDLGFIASGNALKVSLHNGSTTPPDLATNFADGFGISFQPTYRPITQSNYLEYSDGTFPNIDLIAPMYVVSTFIASDGKGSTYQKNFAYYGAHLNLQGRGFDGFYAVREYDYRNSTYEYSYFRRDFPYIGMLYRRDTLESDNTTYIAHTVSTPASVTPGGLAGTSCGTCYSPYMSDTTVYNYEPSGTKSGGASSYVSYVYTTYTYDSYGNLTDTLATSKDTDAIAPVSPFNTLSWTTEIANTITNDNSAANWCLGRPSATTTTKTVPGQGALARTVSHTMDYTNCRATVETVEPNDMRLKVTTSFGFDACGNTNSVSVVGLDQNGAAMAARTTGTSYGTRCALPESVTNPLSQTSHTTNNYYLGLPASTSDPNNITTAAWLYDNFGRKTKETRPDGTYTTYAYTDCVSSSCWGYVDLRFLVGMYAYNSAGTLVRGVNKYYDGLDRLRFDEGTRVLGVWDTAIFIYDQLGNKTQANLPYSSSSNGYHLYGYDVANRLTEDDLYTSGGTFYRSVRMKYQGQTVVVTDPNNHTITKVTDVAGKIRRVTDDGTNAVAGTTSYTFDPFGNLITILDADNITSSYTYNIRGFKTASSDADAGHWTFTPDSLNELVSQLDANGQTISFGYDPLGRMISRVEPEQAPNPTQWVYGTSAAAHSIGRIVQVTKPGTPPYVENYTYDSVGRPQTVTYTENGTNYPFTYAYNNQGTIDTLTYPVSTSGYQFVLKNVYDTAGFLNQVKDNAAGTVFWGLGSANDSNLPTSESLGNGVTVSSTYTPHTNEISSRSEGTGGSTNNVQYLTYHWDPAGNLHDRQDQIQVLAEAFTYDSMNRVLSSTLNGTTNLTMTYDAAGNIASKSDVSASAYVYDTVHKHAVKTAGSWAMTYDANGNMITRAGGSITWKSYNLPATINYNGNSTTFQYNANHQRWMQVANYAGTTETTYYVGGLLEVVTRGSGPTEFRHQIPAGSGTAVYTRRSDGSTGTYYATSDHLGSSDLVMDSVGNVLSRESFTPFGARRGSNWTGVPTAGDYTAFSNSTRKGFTGHEMLDSVNLVHMGGRVYDPFLGRFTSADSVIQNLAATQSVDPYAYAWNDPLKYTDPSGHSLLGSVLGAIAGIIIAIYAPEFLAEFETAYYGAALTAASTALISGFVGGFVGAYIATGSLSAAVTSGLVAGVTAGMLAEVNGYASAAGQAGHAWSPTEKVLAHAAVGCFAGVISGGNCGRDAGAAALEEVSNQEGWIKPHAFATWGSFEGAAEAGLLGGAVSDITGGKFQDGFSVAAAAYLARSWRSNSVAVNGSGSDKAAFAEARKYLSGADPDVAGWFDRADREGLIVNINSWDDDSSVVGSRTVDWDPHSALQTTDGGSQTPALGLFHEMMHAFGDPTVPVYATGDAYDNTEEYRVIHNFETPLAIELGEDVRYDHSGIKTYPVPCSTCR